MRAMADRLNGNFEKAIELLYNSKGRVIISGIGKSGQVARKIAATLSSTGTPAFYIHPTEGVHGDIGMVLSGDVAIVISKSGDTEESSSCCRYSNGSRCRLSRSPAIRIRRWRRSPMSCSMPRSNLEACPLDLVPTSSTTAALVMGDALAVVLLELRGFTADDFSFIHPGGALGRKLIKVADIMHTGEELPIVKQTPISARCCWR